MEHYVFWPNICCIWCVLQFGTSNLIAKYKKHQQKSAIFSKFPGCKPISLLKLTLQYTKTILRKLCQHWKFHNFSSISTLSETLISETFADTLQRLLPQLDDLIIMSKEVRDAVWNFICKKKRTQKILKNFGKPWNN